MNSQSLSISGRRALTWSSRGRQIHRGRALELFNRICPAVDTLLEKGRSRTVDIVLPGTLHGDEPYMNAVTNGVSNAILQDKSQIMTARTIRYPGSVCRFGLLVTEYSRVGKGGSDFFGGD